MRLRGMRAVVTGASRGLGLGVAAALATEGAEVTIVSEEAAELERARARLAGAGSDVRAWCVDLRDRAATLDLGHRLAAEPHGVDVLVNNAAVLYRRGIEETTEQAWDETVAVNLTAPFLLMRLLGPRMAERGGSIVNVSSRAGVMGFAEETAYCAAKFGIEGLTRAAALEWSGRPISVNTITPGARIKPTGVTAEAFDAWSTDQRAGYDDPAMLGPAFVMLAMLRGDPTGCRFDARRVAAAMQAEGFDVTLSRLASLAEVAGKVSA